MLLSIIIPTYNRAVELEKNITMLKSFIENNCFSNLISIIISDNCSTDSTSEFLSSLPHDDGIQIYFQNKNIGLEKNAIFVLEKAISDYVMYLGDDDYIDEKYLIDVVNKLQRDSSFSCIIPSFIGIKPTGDVLEGIGRDLGLLSSFYSKGFDACLKNSYRGHQLSGLVFKREGLLDAYIENKVGNIYPFIFFVAYSTLHGDVWHFPEYPVKVTQPGQEKKDWGYKDDGLVSEIFDNYSKLPEISIIQRYRLETVILTSQSWRYIMYGIKSPIAAFKIFSHKNTSFLAKIAMLYIYPYELVSAIARKKVKRKLFKSIPV